MKNFMGEDFLLNSKTAKKLFSEYAKELPIIDYHCHISPKEIYEDTHYENITQLWLGIGNTYSGDHYKWRLMRSCGVSEKYITGDAPDLERFIQYAKCLEGAIGNPLYHWSHMELKKYFGFDGFLNSENAKEVFTYCSEKLKNKNMSVRSLIEQSNVKLICTTDDPIDNLEWHKLIQNDNSFSVKVFPAFRPDRARNIESNDFCSYIKELSKVSEIKINSFEELKKALIKRIEYFSMNGCSVSDHGMEHVDCSTYSEKEIEEIFSKAVHGQKILKSEAEKYHTAFMIFLGQEYSKRNWVMQIHYGAKRDNNTSAFNKMGKDSGFDCIQSTAESSKLADLLNELEKINCLPKTIIYNLNPAENSSIMSIIGCFQNSSTIGKIQHGSAWWFNDNIDGMTRQLKGLAEQGNLSGFVGMLTDSRSFLSYTRHDYFRRILCNIIGSWVEEGLYPQDYTSLKRIIKDICYNNAIRYFGFPLKEE